MTTVVFSVVILQFEWWTWTLVPRRSHFLSRELKPKRQSRELTQATQHPVRMSSLRDQRNGERVSGVGHVELVITSVSLPENGIRTDRTGVTTYDMKVQLLGGEHWVTKKRYSEMRVFHKCCSVLMEKLIFPPKHVIRNFGRNNPSSTFLENRRQALGEYFCQVLDIGPRIRRELFNFFSVNANVDEFGRMLHTEVSLLRDGTLSEKERALVKLVHLSAGTDNIKAKLIAKKAVPVLLQLLAHDEAHGEDTVKGNAVAILENLSSSDDFFIDTTWNEMVVLLRDGSMNLKGVAMTRLLKLGRDHANTVAIERAGAIPVLLELVQDSFGIYREQAMQVLSMLTEDPESVEAITTAGGIREFVAVLQNGNPNEKEFAAQSLVNMSLTDANRQEIASADGIPPLITLTRIGSPNQRTCALKVLKTLSINAFLKVEIEDAYERTLVEHQTVGGGRLSLAEHYISKVREDDDLQKNQGLLALLSCSRLMKNVKAVVTAGGIPVLMEELSHGNTRGKEQAVKVLALLSRSPESYGEIAASGAIPVLVELLRVGSVGSRERSGCSGKSSLRH